MNADDTPLSLARRRDVELRRKRVQQTLKTMIASGDTITIAATAARAGVHRSFIHRHDDLRSAVITAAENSLTSPAPTATHVSHRSLLAENANLREANRRLSEQISRLEDRLSESLGADAFTRSGLGAPTDIAALQRSRDEQQQVILDLRRQLDEQNEELAAAREAHRRLMTEVNLREHSHE